MQVKIVDGVYGNTIARERRQSKLPSKIAYWATVLFLDALTLATIAVCSWWAGNALISS